MVLVMLVAEVEDTVEEKNEEKEEEAVTAAVETSTHQSIPISSASSKFFDDVGMMPCARSILHSSSIHPLPAHLAAHPHWNVIKHRLR